MYIHIHAKKHKDVTCQAFVCSVRLATRIFMRFSLHYEAERRCKRGHSSIDIYVVPILFALLSPCPFFLTTYRISALKTNWNNERKKGREKKKKGPASVPTSSNHPVLCSHFQLPIAKRLDQIRRVHAATSSSVDHLVIGLHGPPPAPWIWNVWLACLSVIIIGDTRESTGHRHRHKCSSMKRQVRRI
jgi:hypothetical protein